MKREKLRLSAATQAARLSFCGVLGARPTG
jgi:hypothetical protein